MPPGLTTRTELTMGRGHFRDSESGVKGNIGLAPGQPSSLVQGTPGENLNWGNEDKSP